MSRCVGKGAEPWNGVWILLLVVGVGVVSDSSSAAASPSSTSTSKKNAIIDQKMISCGAGDRFDYFLRLLNKLKSKKDR